MLHNHICMIYYQYPCHSEADTTASRKYFSHRYPKLTALPCHNDHVQHDNQQTSLALLNKNPARIIRMPDCHPRQKICHCSYCRYFTMRVPPPETPSCDASVITHSPPPLRTKCSAAFTLGNMDPSENCPCAIYSSA